MLSDDAAPDSQDFLLDPYQRRAFNEVNGFLTPTVNVAWWLLGSKR